MDDKLEMLMKYFDSKWGNIQHIENSRNNHLNVFLIIAGSFFIIVESSLDSIVTLLSSILA